MRKTPTHRPAIADLEIADLPRRLRKRRTGRLHERRRRDLVVRGPRTNLDAIALLADAGEARDARDVDQHLRLAQAKLHERHEAVAAGDQLARAVGSLEL